MACFNPIHISRENPLTGHEEYDVPCGKCASCLKRRQREFAALAVLEASKANSMHFLTLTYNNKTAPIAVSLCGSDEKEKYTFLDDSKRAEVLPLLSRPDNSLYGATIGDYEYWPSLRREDVRLFLKRCRVEWKRLGHDFPRFKYAAFGEYGSATFRPHYHLQFLNADEAFMRFLADSWNRDFGFCDLRSVPRINKDGSNGFLRVSLYVSKYIAKPKDKFPFVADGLVESPRRFSSIHFGTETIPPEQLKRYYLCKDLFHLDETRRLLRIADRSRSLPLEGLHFPLPRRLREQIFYRKTQESKYDPEKRKDVRVTVFKRTQLSRLAVEVARSRDMEDFDKQLRENTKANPDIPFRDVCSFVTAGFLAPAEAREQIARKDLLISSQKEKI